ncbi:hypothetical protein ACPW96_19360 [Micromonospora sp. DT81.3]|uniref:hypothetical protein n=1 Tax=Micromonospora sp. DT81.3 TaxID=3416523 RepID=UPI003CEA0F79
MGNVLRLTAVLSAALLLTACSSTPEVPATDEIASSATTAPAEDEKGQSLPFNAGGLLGGNAAPNLPDGEPDEVAVVQIGPLDKPGIGATLLFAFRNNTSEAISHVDWTATARSGGSIVSTGSSQGATPSQVQPGEIGLAYIYFENGETIPEDAEYEFTVSTSPADTSPYNTAPLKVTEANLSGDAIVGSATNATGAEATGPYGVNVYCFEGDTIVSQFMTFAEQDGEIADGGTVSFTTSLYGEECPSFAVGVSGYFSG